MAVFRRHRKVEYIFICPVVEPDFLTGCIGIVIGYHMK